MESPLQWRARPTGAGAAAAGRVPGRSRRERRLVLAAGSAVLVVGEAMVEGVKLQQRGGGQKV
jgi:hypothetical protein